MKRLLLILTLIIGYYSFAQDTLMKPMERPKPELRKEYFKIYRIFPIAIGNNVLAKANDPNGGIGIGVTFYSFEKLHIMGLYEFSSYKVTDPSLAANVENTNLANLGLEALYKIPVAKNLCINPKFLVAYMTVTQRAQGNRYGRQEGFGFSPGFDVDYKIYGAFRVFAGMNYSISFPETHTRDDYRSFFGVLQQLNVQVGIKF
ncbi:hypothetical protein HYN59_14380 [Flavobacterium album]|uniref:Outer membrane protein beta-barrel domain-containing protein n=1 Tax=Flavobacterium album TaxID=2175091 RepID=A0A2S1R0L9_9FLAO|nr:outer membrane beta-barrel protein [Flavobacterium album]AWH86223.1 hypothetical protein HYN59_14380 [Flavobacterium album]